jgi:hypothetical protein
MSKKMTQDAAEYASIPEAMCPVCEHGITATIHHDPGCWRTANGDGWPESYDVEYHHDSACEWTDEELAEINRQLGVFQ